MPMRHPDARRGLPFFLSIAGALLPVLLPVLAPVLFPFDASAATCKTQAQMPPEQRVALASTSRILLGEVQTGDVQALRQNTLPAVAADFSGIAATVDSLKPFVGKATITVENLFLLDSSAEPLAPRTDFFCGTPVVVMNLTDLPPGIYAVAIIHATGVPQPQQIVLILAQSAGRWMLGGFSYKPMLEAGHDGLWYWIAARKYAQRNMNLDAWFYYKTAAYFLSPVDYLSSPNLDKLQHEEDLVKPTNLPGSRPITLSEQGALYQITSIDTTDALGAFDLEVQYTPNSQQAAELRDPVSARKQVTQVMVALLDLHPELHEAFHGIWVHANQGTASLFSLDLPMDQIIPGPLTPPLSSSPVTNPVIR
jgi:hypothetical protein